MEEEEEVENIEQQETRDDPPVVHKNSLSPCNTLFPPVCKNN
jgi:hypothetical protein